MSILHKSREKFSDDYLELDNRFWDWHTTYQTLKNPSELSQIIWAKECLSLDEINLICQEYAENYGTDNEFYIKLKKVRNEKLFSIWAQE